MDESEDEPRSLPCSAEEAKYMPVMVQLHLVDAALEKLPLHREDFYLQYPVTPERQTPEGERTPPPPVYSPGTILKSEKGWAADVSKTLAQFHAGRLLLRKEETEDHGTLEEDPDYWSSKATDWQGELWKLMIEMGKRKKLELKGEAEEGYALAMLSSPLQSPSLRPMDGSLPEVAQHSKMSNKISDGGPDTSMCSSQLDAGSLQGPSHTKPDPNSHYLRSLTKGVKRTRTAVEDHEEGSLDQISRAKRPRREIATAKQKHKPLPATKSAQDPGERTPNISLTNTPVQPRWKNILKASLAHCTLPWRLWSSNVISERKTGAETVA